MKNILEAIEEDAKESQNAEIPADIRQNEKITVLEKEVERLRSGKGISEDAQVHISIAFLIKAMVAVAVVAGSWYQAQMQLC